MKNGFAAILCAISLPLTAQVSGIAHTTEGDALAGVVVRLCAVESSVSRWERWRSAKPECAAVDMATAGAEGFFQLSAKNVAVADLVMNAEGFTPARRRIAIPDETRLIAERAEMTTGRVTAHGRVVEGATVVLLGVDGAEWITGTDARGEWRAPDPKRWAAEMIVLHPHFAPLVAGAALEQELVARDEKSPAASAARSTLRVDVPQGAEVHVVDLERGMRHSFVGNEPITVAEGRYRVTAHAPRLDFGSREITVRGGDIVNVSLTGTPLARISGRVVNEKGAFVRGVKVSAPARDDDRTTFTAPDGSFLLDVPPDRDRTLRAVRRGFDPRSVAVAQQNDVRIVLQQSAQLVGRVVDGEGAAIADAEITIYDAAPALPMELTPPPMRSDRAGEFAFTLPRGRYELAVRARQFAPRRLRDIVVGDGSEPLRITLQPPAVLRGRVTRGGKPVAGVVVTVEKVSTRTDAKGAFLFEELETGAVMVVFDHDSRRETRAANVPGELNLELESGRALGGRVLDAETRQPIARFVVTVTLAGNEKRAVEHVFDSPDGTFELDEIPEDVLNLDIAAEGYIARRMVIKSDVDVLLSKATVISGVVSAPDGAVAGVVVAVGDIRSTSDAEGRYTLAGVTEGSHVLRAVSDDHEPREMKIDVRGPHQHIDIVLGRGNELHGEVVSENGEPLAGVDIVVRGRMFSRATRSDVQGRFMVEGLPAGAHSLGASLAGFALFRLTRVNVPSNDPLRIELKRGGTIVGTIRGLAPRDVGSVTVSVQADGSGATARANADGTFRVENAPTGNVEVRASVSTRGALRTSNRMTTYVIPGGEARVELDFDAGIVVSGTVTRGGIPLSGARVVFRVLGSDVRGVATTTARGQYEISSLAPELYVVEVYDGDAALLVKRSEQLDRSRIIDFALD